MANLSPCQRLCIIGSRLGEDQRVVILWAPRKIENCIAYIGQLKNGVYIVFTVKFAEIYIKGEMNGDGAFNGQILVDKLAKLNSSQQSIETLSHWCIFHRKKAKQVVEIWEQLFYCSPSDQRVSFLYLANDILQNSRRKGMEFVGEFWKVLPNALNDVIENGDEFGRKAALRLVDIWEERKVFNPRGQTLKEDFLGRNRNEKCISYKLKQPTGDMLEKLISSYNRVYDGYDEDTLFGKCKTAISSVEKVELEIGSNTLDNISDSGVADKLKVQHGLLRECIEQLEVAESSRITLVSHLREALNEQDVKIEQLRNQLKVAQAWHEQMERLLTDQSPPPPPPPDPNLDEVPPPPPPPDNLPEFPSIASSDGSIVQSTTEDAFKRPKLNDGSPGSLPVYLPQLPPLPPFSLPTTMHQPPLTLPSPITNIDMYSNGLPPPLQPMLGFPIVGFPPYPGPTNPYQLQGLDGSGFFGQPPYSATPPPVSRQ